MMQVNKVWPLRVPRELVTSGVFREFTSRDWRLYLTLLLFENTKTHKCWPSYSTISKHSGLSRSAIAESLSHLRELKAIQTRTMKGRRSTYEMPTKFAEASPQIKDRSRLRKRKRDSKGQYQSLNRERNQSAPSGENEITTSLDGPVLETRTTSRQELAKDALSAKNSNSYKQPMNLTPPLPPTGETTHTPHTISEDTIKEWKKVWGADRLKRYLEDHGYPLYSIQEDEEKTSPRGEEANNSGVPMIHTGIGENAT